MNVLGVWNKVGEVYHHFVEGRPLCRRPIKPSGFRGKWPGQSGKTIGGTPLGGFMHPAACPECWKANEARWSGEYGPESGVPLDERSGVA